MQAPPRQTQVQSVRFRFAGKCSIEQCPMDSERERDSKRRMPLFYFKTLEKKEQKEVHT